MMRAHLPLLLALAACKVGPDFVKPNVAVNASWHEANDPRLAAATAADITWWKSFGDPTLDQLIDLAYHQNLSLQAAGYRILEARAQFGVAKGGLWPEGGPSARGTAVRLSENAPTAIPGVDRIYRDYQVGFDAYWELDFWGKYRRGADAAHAEYLATVADYQGALVALSAEVARTYVEFRMYELLIEQANTNVAIQEEALQIAQSRFKNGATSELDVQQATNLLETTRSTIPTLQRELQQSQNALSTLLGRPTGFVQTMLAAHTGLPVLPGKVAVSVPADVLRRRADIRSAEMRAMAQSERIGVAKTDLLPRFTLFGFIGTESSSKGGSLFGPGSFIYNAGGSLLWPILNYTRIRNNIRVEEARFQQTIAEYVETVLRATQEVEDGIAGYLRDQDSTVFAQNAVTAADSAVKIALIQYREGAVDYQRVLETQRSLLESQDLLTRTRSSAVTSLIALYKALGGGWEMRPPQFPGR